METSGGFRDDRNMRKYDHTHFSSNRAVIGVILVIAGLFLIIRNTGFFPNFLDDIIFSWPMLLVTIGLVITIGSSGGKTSGIIVMAVGAFFLIPIIFRETFHVYNMFWPSIFIIVGIIFIFARRQAWSGISSTTQSGDDFVDYVNIFSGGERQVVSDNFKGGKITAIFGGNELDLTKAKLASGINVLEIACVFGGTTIIVPDDWYVKIEVTPILGGFGDSRKLQAGKTYNPEKILIIKGAVIFGGGELKSY